MIPIQAADGILITPAHYLPALAGGESLNAANQSARTFADQGRPAVGSPMFKQLENTISNTPITQGGTLFLDRSKLYNAEGQYNFSDMIKFMNVIAGVNYRLYSLNSKNTLFPDTAKPINVQEYSAYIQMSKKLADDKLSLAASFRDDKNTLFSSPEVTSRASAVYELFSENFLGSLIRMPIVFPQTYRHYKIRLMAITAILPAVQLIF